MPATHTRTFRIRQYECDAYGHLNNSNYVRFMQEAALDASAAVGWDIARYREINHSWVIHETEIEYLDELVYGDSVEIKTWVADFRRVRSRRVYEFRRVRDGQLTARAHTDWIYIDTETLRPAAVPEQMKKDFWPDDTPPPSPKREPLPEPPPEPPGVYRINKRVEWRDIDAAGHLNNAAYFTYIEDVSTQVARGFNWSMQAIEDAGFAIIARRQRVEYRQPAFLDDDVTVSTWVSDVKRATAIRHYTIVRPADSTLLARGRTLWVWVDAKTTRPIRVPADFLADFKANIVE